MSGCPLCERESRTHVYLNNERVWVVDCASCGVPMVVLKSHVRSPSQGDRAYVRSIAETLFPGRQFDDGMRTIPDHYHAHMR